MSQSKLESPFFLSKMAVGPRRAHGCTSPLAYIMKIRTRIVTTAPPCPSTPCEATGQKTAGVSVLFCFVFVSFSVCVICVFPWVVPYSFSFHSFTFHSFKHSPNMKNINIRDNCTFSCFQKVWNLPVL